MAIFIQGMVIGSGPCLLLCAPVVLPLVAGTQRSFWEGFFAVIEFSFGRILVYTLLGGLFGYFGYWLTGFLIDPRAAAAVWVAVGGFIIFLGGLLVFGREWGNQFCHKYSGESLFLMGILVGLSPCLPLLAILTQIALFSRQIWIGALYGLSFGLGTLFSPLIIIGALLPLIPGYLFKEERVRRIFNAICGMTLILVGAYLIFTQF